MVRKIVGIFCCTLALITALCGTVQAATHSVYENGNLSTTYLTYFKDIVSGIGFNENYVAFRSGQYSYTLVVGDLDFNNNTFTLNGTGKEYEYSTTTSTYNSQYYYYVKDISNFSLEVDNQIIYSDLGHYPQLVERGAKYEMLSAVLLCIICLSVVIRRIFYYKR